MSQEPEKKQPTNKMGIGVGIAIGIVLGAAIGAVWSARDKKDA